MNPDNQESQVDVCWKAFEELTNHELYGLLRLRQAVFVVEQNCVFPDIDGLDQLAEHLLVRNDRSQIVGYCRIFCPASGDAPSHIGRVVTAPSHRAGGLGHLIMRAAVARCRVKTDGDIRVAAQSHLIGFYQQHGFQTCGAEYLEDGIPHTDLVLRSAGSP